jgi:DNA-directed RNA polymerase I subunit RPA12
MSNSFNEFCVSCGSILPLPLSIDTSSEIECRVCNNKISVHQFDGITNTTRIVFNSRDLIVKSKSNNNKTNSSTSEGPIVERKCSKCGHDRQTFATLQTRSADEGQTVFYTCVKCGAQENENS